MNNGKNCNAQNESKSVFTEVLQSFSPEIQKAINFLRKLLKTIFFTDSTTITLMLTFLCM